MFNPIMWENMAHAQFDLYTDEGTDYYTVKNNWCERGEISKNKNGSHNTWGTNNKNVSDTIKQAAGLQSTYASNSWLRNKTLLHRILSAMIQRIIRHSHIPRLRPQANL